MKNIFKRLTYIALSGVLLVSCDWDPDTFSELTDSPDPDATYFVQFKDAYGDINPTQIISLSPQGELLEIETDVVVAILGLPLSEALTINIAVDASSTATPDMYILESTSLTIPAGSVSASTPLTSVYDNMPIDEPVTLVLTLDAGGNNATVGTTITYTMLYPEICIPVTGTYRIEMHDSYGDGWQTNDPNGGNGIIVTIDGVVTEVGMCTDYQASPYEGCVAGDSFEATTFVEIPQPSFDVLWEFAGDTYGEISFEIYDPNDNLVFSRPQGVDTGGIKKLDFEVCQ